MKISEKHGVNPSVEVCFWCGKSKGIVLFGKIKKDKEAPRKCSLNYEPCDKCKEDMALGITLIEARENSFGQYDTPIHPGIWPTGNWIVIRREKAKEILSGEKAEEVLEEGKAFIDSKTWEALGLSIMESRK